MARFFKHILFLISSVFLLTSCQEGGDAGDLLGQWRMTGTDNRYLSFAGSVALVRYVDNSTYQLSGEVYANFQHVGDSLFIQCYSITAAPTDTAVVENAYGFQPFNNIRLKVESLNGDELVLSSHGRFWSFQKY